MLILCLIVKMIYMSMAFASHGRQENWPINNGNPGELTMLELARTVKELMKGDKWAQSTIIILEILRCLSLLKGGPILFNPFYFVSLFTISKFMTPCFRKSQCRLLFTKRFGDAFVYYALLITVYQYF